MTKLKLGPLADDKPVKIAVELPAAIHRDLVNYAEVLGRTTGQAVSHERGKAGDCGELNHPGQMMENESAERTILAGRGISAPSTNPNSRGILYKVELSGHARGSLAIPKGKTLRRTAWKR
ncbi:hypothetical protein V1282_001350 [Nitrobacteraceae bacterium AZCC 2146]